ncbi:MAG: hypothetical protein LAO08_12940 [Acidobacteriia bacterium]|nr:hypothetical protein [Terriglobia bacterium]
MRFAKFSRTLLPLALPVVLATCAFAQEHPNVSPNSVRDQLMQAPGGSQPTAAPQAPASEPIQNTAKKAPAKAKAPDKAPPAAAKAPQKAPPAAAKAPAKTPLAAAKAPAAEKAGAKAASAKPAAAPAEKAAAEKPAAEKTTVARRDPFEALLNKAQAANAPPENLPPGKAGLVVGSLHIDGIVRGSGGMIAIVSNPQRRVYFLREGDKLYDGSVDKITLEAISFHEFGKDAFGKPLERQVTKRLYPSPGEQQ